MGANVLTLPEHEQHAAHIDEVAAPLRLVLRERIIDVVTLRRELRLIVGLAVAQLLAAALLLALKNASGGIFAPTLYAFPGEGGNGIQLISDAAFLIGIALTTAAWALLLAGAFRAGVVIRLVVFGLFFAAFFTERDALVGLGADVHVAVFLLMAVIAVLGVLTWPAEHGRIVAEEQTGPVYSRLRSVMPLLLFLLVASVYLAVFLASAGADAGQSLQPQETQVSVFTNAVFNQLDNIQYLLIPVLVLTGSDFAEWGQLAVARLARRVRTAIPRPVFVGFVALACAGIAYDGIAASLSADGGGWAELAFAAVVFALAGFLYLVAKPRDQWGTSIPFMAIAAVAILDSASGFIVEALQGSSGHLDDYVQLASAALWVAGGIVAITVLLFRRGRLSIGWCVALVFVALIGATDLLGSIWVLGNFDNPPLGITAATAPYLGPEGFRAAAALLTAAVLLAALLARRLRQLTVPITVLLIATVTIELLSYIDLLYANRSHLERLGASGGLAIGGAAILIVALLMDLAVSGEAITNVSGRIFPRDTRVLAYTGYILLVAATVLMFASLHNEQGKLLESTFDADEWVKEGILFLGIPLTLTFAIAALHRLRAVTADASTP
jgi:hypothetical protein